MVTVYLDPCHISCQLSSCFCYTYHKKKYPIFSFQSYKAEDSHEISSLIFFSKKTMKKYSRLSSAAVINSTIRVKIKKQSGLDLHCLLKIICPNT